MRHTNRLGISRDGAKYHVSEILSKLGVPNRIEAAKWYDQVTRGSESLAAENGRILIVERVVPEGSSRFSDERPDLFANRTRREHEELFHRVGFIQTRVIATSTPLSIVEGVPI